MTNQDENNINTILVNQTKLETIIDIIKDFNSILEQLNIRITNTLNKIELENKKRTSVISFYNILNSYKNALNKFDKDITDSYLEVKQILTEDNNHTTYKKLYKSVKKDIKKYLSMINAQILECENYLNLDCKSESNF